MKLPDYILIGETKCGTTSLYNYLIQHPQILDTFGNGDKVDSTYATKEIRFFDRYYDRGIDWYKSCFPDTPENEITGEATPMYMFRLITIPRIKFHVPQAKLIIMLRNPVDRLYSNFMHNRRWVPGFADRYPDLKNFLYSVHDPDYHLIHRGIYILTLAEWFKAFPREQFHIVITEDFKHDPAREFGKLLAFLNVKSFVPDSFSFFRENKYAPMAPETRIELIDFYRPYNQLLQQFLNRKLNWDL